MTHEEAIKILMGYSHTPQERAALETLIPELCESEDERIRQTLIDMVKRETGFTGFPSQGQVLAYLEKQKDAFENGRQLGIMQEQARQELEWTDEKQKEPTFISDLPPDDKGEPGENGILEKQKEQKPISTEDMPYITDEHFFEREPADSFKYKLAEYMTKNRTGYSYNISSESILQMAKEELIKRGELKEPKPAEWSKEDEKMQYFVNQFLEYHEASDPTAKSCKKWFNNRLKSLRPQPKNEWSEEDEKMIERLITRLNWITNNTRTDGTSPNITFFKEIDWLKSLRPQPKQDKGPIAKFVQAVEDAEQYRKGYEEGLRDGMKKHYKPSDVCYGAKGDPDPAGVWKPSGEQMRALSEAVSTFDGYEESDAIKSLYNDLKKLM